MKLIEQITPNCIIFTRYFQGQETEEEQEWECPLDVESVMNDLSLLDEYIELFNRVCEDTKDYEAEIVFEETDEYSLYNDLVGNSPNDPMDDYRVRMSCTDYDIHIYYNNKTYLVKQ